MTDVKKYLWLLPLFGALLLQGRSIEGRVTIAPSGQPLAGAWLSDGHSFATTDATGAYQLELHPDAATVYVHQSSGYRSDAFYALLKPEQSHYDFTLTATPAHEGQALKIIVIGDPETTDTAYMGEVAAYIGVHPEVDFVLNAGDINGRAGMLAHRRELTSANFPRPIYYVIGNHDIVKRNAGEADCYAEVIAPWYYSFEHKGVLFVTAPMYASWGAPLPYDMKEYGDWLKALLARFPQTQVKVMMAHDIVDLVGFEVPTHSDPIQLDDHNFRAILYGHKHMNVVLGYESGRKSYCTGTTTRGGIGFTAPCFREVSISPDGTTSSSLHYTQLRQLFQVGGDDRNLWATVYHSGDEIIRVSVANVAGDTLELSQAAPLSWVAVLPTPDWQPVGAEAETLSGHRFTAPEVTHTGLRLLTALPQETAMANPIVDGDMLFVAVTDDAAAESGGVYALDRHTGATLWFYPTRYSVRNHMAQDDTYLYAIDTRGNIHAVAKADGTPHWVNPANPAILSPSASGVACADGILIGGYGALLRGIDAATGQSLWRNHAWVERTPGEDQLAIDGATAYVISQLNGLYAHDLRTGEVRWQFKQNFLSGTVCVGDGVLFVKGENDFFKLSAADGIQLASKPLKALKSASAPVLWQDLVIFGTAHQGVIALHQSDLSEAWRFLPGEALITTTYYSEGKPHTVDATPLVRANSVWIGAGDGFLYELEAGSGRERARYFTGAPLAIQGAVATDGDLYFVDMSGKVFSL